MISLGTVNISEKTKRIMNEALSRGAIGQADYIKDFEKCLAEFLNVKHVIAVANGTLADACALAAVKYKDGGKRDEIIVPALTFVAQINAIYYNHLKPVFVDARPDFQINVDDIEKKINKSTLAIMPVHLLGYPAEMDKIRDLAQKYNLYIIEDACEALGSKYQGKLCGTIGDIGCFSFFTSHSISTGEGGAIVTDNDEIARLLRLLRNHGRKSEESEDKFLFSFIGFSAKMNSLEAIIGLGIIDRLSEFVEKRHQNMEKLDNLIGKNSFKKEADRYVVPHAYPIIAKNKESRDGCLKLFPEKFGVEARQIFYSIPTQSEAYKFLNEELRTYPVAEDIGNRGFYVPCHQNLTDEDLMAIAGAIKKYDFC